jgi:hypothetical protein
MEKSVLNINDFKLIKDMGKLNKLLIGVGNYGNVKKAKVINKSFIKEDYVAIKFILYHIYEKNKTEVYLFY